MAISREEVNDSVQGLVGVVGVECTQTQVTSFRERDRMVHGFTRAHLANQNYIWCLPPGVFQRNFRRLSVNSYFAPSNNSTLMPVNKLNRVFNRNNMAFGVLVAMTNHRGERG